MGGQDAHPTKSYVTVCGTGKMPVLKKSYVTVCGTGKMPVLKKSYVTVCGTGKMPVLKKSCNNFQPVNTQTPLRRK